MISLSPRLSPLLQTSDLLEGRIPGIILSISGRIFSFLRACSNSYQIFTGRLLVTLIPSSICRFMTRSIDVSISRANTLNEEQFSPIKTRIFLTETITKIATYLVIAYIFFKNITHLVNLHRKSKNPLKFVYFSYQAHKITCLFKSSFEFVRANLSPLSTIKKSITQAESKPTFDQILADTKQYKYNQKIKVIWLKQHIKQLSEEQLNQLLSTFFPEVLTIHDLANILTQYQFETFVVPKIREIIKEGNSIYQQIRPMEWTDGRSSIYLREKTPLLTKSEARNLFPRFNACSKKLYEIIHQMKKTSNNTAFEDLLIDAKQTYDLLEPKLEIGDISPRESLLYYMFDKNHRFKSNDEAWIILLFHGLNIFDAPIISDNLQDLLQSRHPVEHVQKIFKLAGLATYRDLQEKGILAHTKEGFPPSKLNLFDRFMQCYLKTTSYSFIEKFPEIFFRGLAQYVESSVERFLVQTD